MAERNDRNERKETMEDREQREPFVITNDNPEEFVGIGEVRYMKASDFGHKVYQIFKPIFADFYGALLTPPTQNSPSMVTLYFDHVDRSNQDVLLGISRDLEDTRETKNELLRRVRMYDHRMSVGDRYYLTREGKEAIAPFLFDDRAVYDRNGKPNWGKIVAESTPQQNVYGYVASQLTIATFIDPAKIIEFIYGKKNAKGDDVVYRFEDLGSSNPGNQYPYNTVRPDRIVSIQALNVSEMYKITGDIGFTNGSGIITH